MRKMIPVVGCMIDQVAWENALELEVRQITFHQSIFTKREFIDHRKEDYAKTNFYP